MCENVRKQIQIKGSSLESVIKINEINQSKRDVTSTALLLNLQTFAIKSVTDHGKRFEDATVEQKQTNSCATIIADVLGEINNQGKKRANQLTMQTGFFSIQGKL